MACDRFPVFDRIGVVRAADGENIVVYYLACPGELVTLVELRDAGSGGSATGAERVLWQITSDQGPTRTEFQVGSVPPGFVERVAYSGRIEPTQRLVAFVDLGPRMGGSIRFTSADLDSTCLREWKAIGQPDAGRVRGTSPLQLPRIGRSPLWRSGGKTTTDDPAACNSFVARACAPHLAIRRFCCRRVRRVATERVHSARM